MLICSEMDAFGVQMDGLVYILRGFENYSARKSKGLKR